MTTETDDTKQYDPIYATACEIVRGSREPTISTLQRALLIGYNRASRLLEAMEADGIVSAMDEFGARKLLTHNVEVRRGPTTEGETK